MLLAPPQIKLITDPAEIAKLFNHKTKAFGAAQSETGKSTIGRFIQDLPVNPRKVIVDTLGEYKKPDDMKYVVTGALEFAKRMKEVKQNDKFKIIYKLPLGQDNVKEQHEKVCEIIYKTGWIHLTTEETHHYCTPHQIGYWFSLLNTGGRHQDCGLYNSSQRWSKCHGDVIGLSQIKFCGQQGYHRDFQTSNEYFPGCEPVVRAQVPFEFLMSHNNIISSMNTSILLPKS